MATSWIHFNKSTGDKNDTVQVTCDANTTINERTAQITISTSNGEKSELILMTQEGLPDLYNIKFTLPASIDNHLPYVNQKAYLAKAKTTDKGNMVAFGKVTVIAGKFLTVALTRAELEGIIKVLTNSFLSGSPKLYLYSEKSGIINPELLGVINKQASGDASDYVASLLEEYANLQTSIEVITLISEGAVTLTGSIDLSLNSNLIDNNPYRGDLILEAAVSERGNMKYYECGRVYLNNDLSSSYKRTVDLSSMSFTPTEGTSPVLAAVRFRHSQLSTGSPRVCTVTMPSSFYAEVSYSNLASNSKENFAGSTNAAGLAPLNGEISLTDASSLKLANSQLRGSIEIKLM